MKKEGEKILMTACANGGIWTYTSNLVQELAKHGCEIHLAIMGQKLTSEQQFLLSEVENLSVYESLYSFEWSDRADANQDSKEQWLLNLEHKIRPDFIHLNSITQGAIPFSAPVITVCHSNKIALQCDGKELPTERTNAFRERVALSFQRSDLIVGTTKCTLDKLEALYGPIPNTALIYNGVNCLMYNYHQEKEELILSVASDTDELKAYKNLENTAPKIDWEIRVVNDATEPKEIASEFAYLKCEFQSSHNQIKKELSKASVFVQPAQANPFELPSIEAAFCGCAILVNDTASSRELWEDCAVYFDPEDPQDLQDKLKKLQDNFYWRDEMARRARNRAFHFTVETSAQNYLNIYNKLKINELQPAHMA